MTKHIHQWKTQDNSDDKIIQQLCACGDKRVMSMTSMKPENIILEGMTGSKAYGLDTPDSDEDIKGVYVAPTSQVLGLFGVKETIDHTQPDWTYHELGKFLNLAMKCNPTILELLFILDCLLAFRFLNFQGAVWPGHAFNTAARPGGGRYHLNLFSKRIHKSSIAHTKTTAKWETVVLVFLQLKYISQSRTSTQEVLK